MTLLVIYAVFTVGVSFVCSLLESAFLSAPSAALRARQKEQADAPSAGINHLLDIKGRRIDDALSAILVLNTVANTLGAVMVGSEARAWARTSLPDSVDLLAGIVAGILTFVILTFSEIIPKTLGAVYSRPLAPFVGHALAILVRIMAPVLFFTGVLTRLVTRGKKHVISRAELAAFIAMAAKEGALDGHETRLYTNLMKIDSIRLFDVMTPRTVAVMVPVTTTLQEFLADPSTLAFSRIPVYRTDRDDVIGYVLQKEVLRAIVEGHPRTDDLSSFIRDTWFLPEVVTLGNALREFQHRREPLAMVADEHGGVGGLVTLEDLVETVLGVEILDESDEVADLRHVAEQIRDHRLEELAKRRALRPAESPPSS